MEDLFSVEINLSVEPCEATALALVQTPPPHVNYYYRRGKTN